MLDPVHAVAGACGFDCPSQPHFVLEKGYTPSEVPFVLQRIQELDVVSPPNVLKQHLGVFLIVAGLVMVVVGPPLDGGAKFILVVTGVVLIIGGALLANLLQSWEIDAYMGRLDEVCVRPHGHGLWELETEWQ
ncbi:hypothetical protein T484DRAFT_1781688 [Baffinella frigidus]|nr:hypothetical protein T484DRAFT_1781688 [Cryptophyta sp. CCMP2293]